MKYNDIVEFARVCKLATFGDTCITATTPKMRKTNNPYYGRVVRLTYASRVAVYHYGRTLEQHIANANGCTRQEVHYEYDQSRCVKNWLVKPIIATNGQYVYYYRKNAIVYYAYLLDGEFADAATIAQIESFCSDINAFSDNPKQLAEGISRDEQVWTKRPSCTNVLYYANCDNWYGSDALKEDIITNGIKHTFETDLG